MADFAGIATDRIGVSIDGCGLPTFQVPLGSLALAFARLTDPERASAMRLMDCARKYPEMIGGDNRICTDLPRATRGRVFGKVGGEGVYGISLFESGWGVAIKIEDGSLRALGPTVTEILKRLGVLGHEELDQLKAYHEPEVTNYRREVVGRVRAVLDLKRA
jgi:L-asparaginase II